MSEEKKLEAYPSIERSLDKIVDKLEGYTDNIYEESVPSVEKSLYKIADLFDPGSKEGGVFNVQLEITETNANGHYATIYKLNKTYNEIYNAFLTQPVLIHSQERGIGIITNVGHDEHSGYFIGITIDGGLGLYTIDPDGYPEFIMT